MGNSNPNFISDPDFPNSYRDKFEVTSPRASNYNCIAWAAGDNTRWWEPDEDYYWPEKLPLNHTVATVTLLFEQLGYETCENEDLESDYEKVVLFSKDAYECIHAARQLSNGYWTSKLGVEVDISHTIFSFQRGFYGKVVKILKRKKNKLIEEI